MISIIWIAVLIGLIVAEIATVTFVTIWFAGGAFVAFILSLFDVSLPIQILVFGIVSALLLIFTRPIAIKYLKVGKEKTNVDSLIGKTAKVTQTIDNGNEIGKLIIAGQEWTARSSTEETIEENSIVEVKRVEGVKLIVTRISETST